ncbi:MAG: hypothetical protein OER91_04710 [Gammaproteobacteria bacterium]|nr:hypothetical protein [Gammaproteobacteria bacterium]
MLGLLCLFGAAQAGESNPDKPGIGLKKSLDGIWANDDGTYSVRITLAVRNTGNEDLARLQINNGLDFVAPDQIVEVGVPQVLTGDLTPNPYYDGVTDMRLLQGDDELAIGYDGSLAIEFRLRPDGDSGPYVSEAMAWAEGKYSGKIVKDRDSCKISLPLVPTADFEKTVGEVLLNDDGSYTTEITLIAENTGPEDLVKLQFKDDLDIFGSGRLLAIGDVEVLEGSLTLNPGYDGRRDIELLQGHDELIRGARASLRFEITFDAGAEPGPFENCAILWFAGRDSGVGVDIEDCADVHLPRQPEISVELLAGAVTLNDDGSQSVPMTITVTNTGGDELEGVSLEDSLDIFGTGTVLAVESLASADLTPNTNYDGLTDTQLLSGTDTLPVSGTGTVTFVLRFDPGDESGPFTNTVTATGTGVVSAETASATATATFDRVEDPGPDPASAIAVQKDAGAVTLNDDGSQSVPITITVSNTGDDELQSLLLEDDLDIFGTGTLVAVESLASDGLSLNPNYDGLTDTQLLSGTDTLPVFGTGTVTFVLRFDPGDEAGPFANTVTTTATGVVSAEQVSDTATATFDRLGDPGPGPGQDPSIAVQKGAGEVTLNDDGSQSVPITITVSNTGDDELQGLLLEDDLDIFGTGTLVAVESLASDGLSLNPNYDGLTDAQLLSGTDTLPVSGTGTVTFVLRFDPADEAGPFTNTVTASGTGVVSAELVTDTATATFEPLGDPGPGPGQQPAIAVEKDAGEVTLNDDGSQSVSLMITVSNTGDDELGSVLLDDSLDIFGTGTVLAVESLVSADLTLNTNYDGLTDTQLLSGTDTLPVSGTGTVTFVLRFDPADEAGPFTNTVTATATGVVSAEQVSATATATFDRLGDPGPGPGQAPSIEVQKAAGTVTANDDGSQSVPITITVSNTGDDELQSVLLEDDLDIFGTGTLLAVESLASDELTLNTNYDGLTDTQLLSGTDTLPVSGTGTVTFVLRFDPADEAGPFTNTVTASGTGVVSAELVTDTATATFEPLGDPGPGPGQQPAIAVEKDAGEVMLNDDGSQSVPLTITVSNTGDDELNSVSLEDSLDIFGTGTVLAVESLVSDDLTLNPDYDGLTDTQLLIGTDTLPLSGTGTVTFVLRFDPAEEPGPFANTVTATGIGVVSAETVSATATATFEPLEDLGPGPDSDSAIVSVSKQADKREVARGDVLGYQLAVRNLSSIPVSGVEVSDEPPPGFRLVEDSGYLIRAGSDGALNTGDDLIVPLPATGVRPVLFSTFDLGPDERVLIRYLMRVSVGVADGQYINSVTVNVPLFEPAKATAPVTVVGDPMFEKTTLIGKVFHDRIANSRQDEGEPGIAGVRLATVDGLLIETDAMGRFHLADVDVARFERGGNFIIKLDESTLPEGARVVSENPRLIRLTQATMSKVNFAIEYPDADLLPCSQSCLVDNQWIEQRSLQPEMCVGATPYDRDEVLNFLRLQCANPPENRCTPPHTGEVDTSEARRVMVSGGLFGCSVLVADTLPGRLDPTNSEITVYAGQTGVDYKEGERCSVPEAEQLCPGFPTLNVANQADPSGPSIELTTEQGTRLEITSSGDVIRRRHPENDEHIVVTPFRDDSDNAEISALRIVNDGTAPASADEGISEFDEQPDGIATVTGDVFVHDPRLDVLALNHAVLGSDNRLLEPIRFAIYTNYAAFIKTYRIEVFGSAANGSKKTLLHTDKFSEYDFGRIREFDGSDVDLRPYVELEYRLQASNCDNSFDARSCDIDETSGRILNLREDNGTAADHAASELWGQSSLVAQRIGLSGGRARVSGKVPDSSRFEINGAYVPVSDDGTWVLEEYLPLGKHRFDFGSESASADDPDFISADAEKIKVSGGLFGCGQVEIDLLRGRSVNSDDPPHTATVVAESRKEKVVADDCPLAVSSGSCPIEVSTEEGTRLCVTQSGDVLIRQQPSPGLNRQQLVVTPFRDHTDNRKITALRIVNEGLQVQLPKESARTGVEIEFDEDQWFTVALASLTVGQNNLSGNGSLLSADEHFDGSTFVDGRLAFYTKGRVNDRFLITAQLDTTEDQLKDLGDALRRKDPRRIFRQLDPNRYYPTYGDDSTTITDVDTQGAFYARVDWDRNSALWGNYNTGLTDTEFMQYNRSLYGAKFDHESTRTTELGDAKSKAIVFASEAQSLAAHVTFRATGGSLYYLRDTDIVQGSEKIWVEVRRRDTEQVVERAALIEGRDYEIDAIQGRIILRRPLSQVVNDRGLSIVRSSPLEGDKVFLLVDYEYVPSAFAAEDLTYGGRGQVWLGDHVAIGAGGVADERDGTDYSMHGLDLTLKLNDRSYLRAEFAQSRARQNNANFVSLDGGLTFQAQTGSSPGADIDGSAMAVELRTDLTGLGKGLDGDFHAWWKSRDAEFSTGRLGQGFDVHDAGFELHANIGDNFDLVASHTDLEREQRSRERVTRVQVQGRVGELDAGLEVRHDDVEIQALGTGAPLSLLNGTDSDGKALLIGARLGYELSEETSVYAVGQTVADERGAYEENDLFTLGVNTKLNDALAVSLEASDGDRGSAVTTGIDYALDSGLNFQVAAGVGSGATSQVATRYAIGEGHELYGSYAVDTDRTELARNLLTLGQRRAFGNGIDLFAESQFGKGDQHAGVGHVFGLDFEGKDDWRFSASVQFGEYDQLEQLFDRRALSLGAYRNLGKFKLASRIEYREDDGPDVHSRQYVTSTSVTRKLDDNRRWLGQLNLAWTDDKLNGGRDARFVELDVGYAYRPAGNDNLNLIARYSFLFDLPTEGQETLRPDERSHLVAVEGIYDLQNRWELAAKIAIRQGERRSFRDEGSWDDFGLRMISTRARYALTRKWDALAEYRWLSDIDGKEDRHGALLTLYRHVNDHMKVGVGFNFTDFSDELRSDDYNSNGWFIDIVGMY